MKLEQFEDAVRTASHPEDEPASLSATIDRRLDRAKARRLATRRFRWAFAACGAATLVSLGLPTVRVEAQMRRIAGALDGVRTLLIQKYSFDSQGKPHPDGSIAYSDGMWRVDDGPSRLVLFRDGMSYRFDPFTQTTIVEPKDSGPFRNSSLRLSSVLGSSEGFGRGIEIDRDAALNGRPAIRATLENKPFNERITIYADRTTELPIEAFVDAREQGRWIRRQAMRFDYAARLDARQFRPDLNGKPAISIDGWKKRVVDTMTSVELGSTPLKRGRLVVRSVDVADDGTVYVAYQSGTKSRSWTGYALEISDSLHTPYCHADEIFSDVDDAFIDGSVDGKLEVEVFVPIRPIDRSADRQISIMAGVSKDGALARMIRMGITHPDGTVDLRWGKNRQSADESPFGDRRETLYTGNLRIPTCAAVPSYMQLVDPTSYGNDIRARIAQAGARVRYYEDEGDDRLAEVWLREKLSLIEEHQARGLGILSRTRVLEALDKIKSRRR